MWSRVAGIGTKGFLENPKLMWFLKNFLQNIWKVVNLPIQKFPHYTVVPLSKNHHNMLFHMCDTLK